MATEAIDTAYVEIQPDFKDFDKSVERDIKGSLEELVPAVRDLIDEMEHQFTELISQLGHEFDDLSRSISTDLNYIYEATNRTTEEISASFREGTNSAGRQFDQLARGATHDLEKIDHKVDETSKGMQSGFGGLLAGGALFGGVFAAASGLQQLTSFGLQSAASLEQTQIQFKALTGSAQQGQQVLTQLQKFAALTPFEFPDVAHAAARFLTFDDAVGISDSGLQDFLTTVGNVISVTGGGAQALDTVTLAMGQISSTGKLTLDNLNQISEALPGFSGVAAIASARGESTAQVMQEISKGEISAKDGIQALLAGMQKFPGAAGAMEAQGQTLLGVFSTFKDTIGQALAQAFNPVIPAIKDSLAQITPILGDALTKVAPAIGNVLAGLLPLAGQLVNALVPILTPLINGLTPALAGIGGALKPLGDALGQIATAAAPILPVLGGLIGSLASGLAPIITALAPGIGALVDAFKDIAVSLGPVLEDLGGQLGQILAPFVNQLVIAFETLGPAIEGLLPLFAQLGGVYLQALAQVLPQILQAFLPLAPVIAQLAPSFAQILIALVPLAQLFAELALDLTPLLVLLIQFVVKLADLGILDVIIPSLLQFANVINLIAKPIQALTGWLRSTRESAGGFGKVFANIGHDIANVFTTAWGAISKFFSELPGEILSFIQALPGEVVAIFKQMFYDIFYAIGFGIGSIIAEWLALPGQIVAIVSFLWNAAVTQFKLGISLVLGAVKWLWTDFPGLVKQGLEAALSWFRSKIAEMVGVMRSLPGQAASAASSLWSSIKNAIGDVGHLAEDVGKDIINGIIRGIKNGASALADAAKNAAHAALDGAKKALGISSPSKEFYKLGEFSVQGFQNAVTDNIPMVGGATASAMDALLGRVGASASNTTNNTASSAVTIGSGAVVINVSGTNTSGQQLGQQAGQALLNVLQNAGFITYNQPRTV